MQFLEITDNELLNVELIDNQHKKVAELINKLHAELGAKFDGESKRLLNQLGDVLREHFDTEEKLMTDHNYVNYFSHKMEHDRYYNKFISYKDEVEKGTKMLDLEFLKSARRWFFNHFELNDKKCGQFFISQGLC